MLPTQSYLSTNTYPLSSLPDIHGASSEEPVLFYDALYEPTSSNESSNSNSVQEQKPYNLQILAIMLSNLGKLCDQSSTLIELPVALSILKNAESHFQKNIPFSFYSHGLTTVIMTAGETKNIIIDVNDASFAILNTQKTQKNLSIYMEDFTCPRFILRVHNIKKSRTTYYKNIDIDFLNKSIRHYPLELRLKFLTSLIRDMAKERAKKIALNIISYDKSSKPKSIFFNCSVLNLPLSFTNNPNYLEILSRRIFTTEEITILYVRTKKYCGNKLIFQLFQSFSKILNIEVSSNPL